MMMKMNRLNALKNFAEATQLLVTAAQQTSITCSDVEHLRALEPEFDGAVETLLQLFGATASTTTTPEEPVIEEPTVETPTIVEPVVIDDIELKAGEASAVEEPKVEETSERWERLPKLQHIEVSNLGHVKCQGKPSVPRMVCGYMKFYDSSTRKYYSLAKAVLTAFIGERDATHAPYYKDGNKENCELENLRWSTRDSSLTTSQIERACKLISENPDLPETEMVNMLVREHTIKSVTALRSILSGNWRTISDRYFLVRQGRIIPVEETTSTPTTAQVDEVDDSGNLKGILSLTKDPAFVNRLYMERLEAHKASSDDLVALILSYMMLGLEDVAAIQKAIRKDFGRKLMVSNAQLKAIIGG
jgi:hypothetical protein